MKRFFFPTIILLLFVSCQKDVYYIISTTVNPKDAGSVSVSPAGPSVLEGTSVTVTAQPKGEYVFTGWSGSLSGTDNPKTISVTSDLNITANFALKEYPLSISVEGEGAVSEKVISTKTDYTSGTIVELTAKAADHWLFDHWEGDLNGNTNPVQIAVSSAKTVKAVFVKKMYDLTIEVQGEGAVQETVVNTKSSSYQEGTVVEVTALPGEHWVFDHWEGDLSGNKNPAQITIASAKKVKAVFVEKMYPLTVEIKGTGAVKEEVISTKSGTYQEGTIVELTATPGSHWLFDHWEGDLEGNENPVQVTINASTSVKAVFVEKVFPLTVEIQGGGAVKEEVISTKSGSYQEGSVVQLTASPNTYWAFDHWEGDVTGSDNPATITISAAATVRAVFVENDPGIVFTETEYISAIEINRRMGLGLNVGSQLEVYREDQGRCTVDEEAWGNGEVTQEYFYKIAEAGIKSVRIPVTWMGTYGPAPDYVIDEKRMNRVAEVVDYALNAGLFAIINMHHDNSIGDIQKHPYPDDFWINPVRAADDPVVNHQVKEQLTAMWTQIARKFRNRDEHLIFESFNEPGSGFMWSWASDAEKDAHQGEYDRISEWNQTFVDAVRATGGNNAKRWLVLVGGGGKERNLDRLVIPHDYVSNNRFMLAVHVYEPEPYVFGEYDEWGHSAKAFNEEIGRFDEHFIEKEFARYKKNYLDKDIPLCIDEAGCFNRLTERGRAFQLYYLEYLTRASALNSCAIFIWDDGGQGDATYIGESLFWHDTGEYFGYSEETVKIIRNAMYSTDPEYTLQSIYDRAPFYDPADENPILITDSGFKEYLLEHFDLNGDGEISTVEARRILSIDIVTDNVESLTGIEQMENLRELRCRGTLDWIGTEFGPGLLTSIDVSHNPKLRLLWCNNNHITSLNLSQNHELEDLCIRSNGMTELNLSHNTRIMWYDGTFNRIKTLDLSLNKELRNIYHCANGLNQIDGLASLSRLEILCLDNNELRELNVSDNYLLRELSFFNNDIKSIDVSYNQELSVLRCFGNSGLQTIYMHKNQQLSSLEKDDFTQVVYDSGVVIPDAAFRKYVLSHFDTNGDKSLSEEEAFRVTEMNVCTDQVYSLSGIEHFVNLKELVCMGSYEEEYTAQDFYGVLTELDISQNTQLEILCCAYNQLTELDVSKNPNLKILRFHNNKVASIDISNNQLLEELVCRNCQLKALDVSHNPLLREIDCQGSNRIKSVDISQCPAITLLNANGVGLETLDVSRNEDLSWLGCAGSSFTSIDLSANSHLFCFYGDANSLSELDLTQNPEMEYLYIRESPKLQAVYLKTGQSIPNIYKDSHTEIRYKE